MAHLSLLLLELVRDFAEALLALCEEAAAAWGLDA
jgi:hypothetical protein